MISQDEQDLTWFFTESEGECSRLRAIDYSNPVVDGGTFISEPMPNLRSTRRHRLIRERLEELPPASLVILFRLYGPQWRTSPAYGTFGFVAPVVEYTPTVERHALTQGVEPRAYLESRLTDAEFCKRVRREAEKLAREALEEFRHA